MRRTVPFVLLGLLAACADTLAARQAYLSKFVGQPDTAVVEAMGVPNRTYEASGTRFLAYDERRVDILPGMPGYGPWFNGWYSGGFPPQVVERKCETTFEIADGLVRAFTLRGNACG